MPIFFIVLLILCGEGTNICQTFCWISCVYKNTVIECHIEVWNANFICYATQLPGGEEGIFLNSEFDLFSFDDLHLQINASISPKASVENSSAQWTFFVVVVVDLHLQIIEIISPTKHQTSRLYLNIGPLNFGRGGEIILLHNETKCFNKARTFIISFFFVSWIIYTCKLFKAFPPYFTPSDICHKSSFCLQSTVIECILNLLDPSTAWGAIIK